MSKMYVVMVDDDLIAGCVNKEIALRVADETIDAIYETAHQMNGANEVYVKNHKTTVTEFNDWTVVGTGEVNALIYQVEFKLE